MEPVDDLSDSGYPPLWRLLLVSGLIFLVFYIYDKTAFSYWVENRVSLPTLFQIRDLLGKSGDVSDELKIISFDDSTLGALGKSDLSVYDWAVLLREISLRKPRAIFIDKLFAVDSLEPEKNEQAGEILQALSVPVATISFVTPSKLLARKDLDLKDSRYDILSLYPNKLAMLNHSFIPMLDRRGWHVYGPHKSLQSYFTHIGHALNADYGKAEPIIQISASKMLPHVAFVGPFQLSVQGNNFYSNGVRVPTDANGKVLVNFFEQAQFFSRNTRLMNILNQISANKPIESISSGDVVLILPAMYTGGTDFIRTPLGPMPGGYVIASILNSHLTRRWISPMSWEGESVLIACLLGVPVVFLMGNYLWSYVLAILSIYFCLASYLFSYSGLLVNVSVPTGAFLTSIAVFLTFRNQVREKLIFFLRVLKTENEELRSEIDQASQIAKVFNPEKAPEWGALQVSAYHETLIAASGDWYAFESSPSGSFRHLLMCDITGHGVQAAIIVSACKTVLSLIIQRFPEYLEGLDFFEHYMRLLNSTLYSQGRGQHITTFVGISFSMSQQKAYYITAGHPPPFLFRQNSLKRDFEIFSLNSRHNPLGLFFDMKPRGEEISIQPGDTLLVYTDGLPIPRNPRYLVPAVQEIVDEGVGSDSGERLARRVRKLSRNQVKAVAADDLSVVVVHWKTAI